MNPLAQVQQPVTLDEVLASPPVAGGADPAHVQLVHRRRGRRGPGRCGVGGPRGAPRLVGSVARSGNGEIDYHDRLEQVRPAGLGGRSGSAPGTSTWSSCTTPPAPRSSTPSSRSASSPPARPARPPWPAPPTVGRAGGHRQPERRPGRPGPPPRGHRASPRSSSWSPSCGAGPAPARSRAPGWAWPSTPAGSSRATPPSSASTPWPRAADAVPGIIVTGWGIAVPDKVVTNDDLSASPRHERRVDHRADRHPRAPRRRHHLGAGHRGRPARPSSAPGVDPGGHRRSWCSPPPRPTPWCPGTATTVQDALGIAGGAFDLNAACSGFVYGLVVGAGLIATGCRPRPPDRGRHAEPDHRLGRPHAWPCWSATGRAPWCSRRSTGPATC